MRWGALLSLMAVALLAPASAQADFGPLPGQEGFDVAALRTGGEDPQPQTLGGSHPFALRTELDFELDGGESDGDLRDLHIDLPPGMIENPRAVTQCSQADFSTPRVSPYAPTLSGENCSRLSQIGTITLELGLSSEPLTFGLFNLAPSPGVPSELGASPLGTPITLSPHVRERGGEFGLTLDLVSFPQRFDLRGLRLDVWGVPWSPANDGERGDCLNETDSLHPHAKCSIEPPSPPPHSTQPYLTMPSSCDAPLTFSAQLTSWQGDTAEASAVSRDADGEPAALQGCDTLQFEPKPVARLTTERTTSSTGFDFTLDGNANGLLNPKLRAGSQVRDATVALADGVTINPSLGAGLGVCTLARFQAIRGNSGADCPNDSKIGEVVVESPLFEGPIEGGVFLAKPDDPQSGEAGAENPFDTLIALYMVARSPLRGIAVKVAGELKTDPGNGNLVAHFHDLPQLPYSHFKVHFRDGQRSPLASPPRCGTHTTAIDLAPWDDPEDHVQASSRFDLNTGIGGGPCPGGGDQPFAPTAKGGTSNRNASSYSPFYLRLARNDSEQEITSYSATLPPGLIGKITGVPYCPEAAIAHAAQNSGFAEAENPSCPEASMIGHTTAGYGLGSTLTYAPGGLYLAGPYGGQPFSVVAIDSATVGPFDLGVIIVRSAIKVDPLTAQVSIDSAASDPIPHIIGGIPIHLRDVRVYIDRKELMLNPTNCDPMSLDSLLTGASRDLASRADDSTGVASVPFQVSNCSALGFRPSLSFRLQGHAQRGDYPRLTATYRPRPGDANSRSVTATLAKTMFLAQSHIDTICTRKQFAANNCPAGSVYGRATAITPLLGAPLKGPVYLRSSGHALPDLVAAISGGGVSIEVVGRTSSYKGGLRAVFNNLPDAPVKRFTMQLFGGEKGLLQAAADVCTDPQPASVRMVGQNNLGLVSHPRLVAECKRDKKAKRGRKR